MDETFKNSELSPWYDGCEVTDLSPGQANKGIQVQCEIKFCQEPESAIGIGQIGIAFLKTLRIQHGHTWLGNYSVDVQSIGFQSMLNKILITLLLIEKKQFNKTNITLVFLHNSEW